MNFLKAKKILKENGYICENHKLWYRNMFDRKIMERSYKNFINIITTISEEYDLNCDKISTNRYTLNSIIVQLIPTDNVVKIIDGDSVNYYQPKGW